VGERAKAAKIMCLIGPARVDRKMLLYRSKQSRKRGDERRKRLYRMVSNLSKVMHKTQNASGSLNETQIKIRNRR
jgi:hypothetical protein